MLNEPSDRQDDIYDQVRVLSARAEETVKLVVANYAKQLDDFVTVVEETLDKRTDFDDKTMHRLVLRLPILMYRIVDGVDRAAIESDMAKAITKLVYARHYLEAHGTIQAKQSRADVLTADETQVVELTKHVYSRLKGKLDKAEALFDAVRKVITDRGSERAIFGRDRR